MLDASIFDKLEAIARALQRRDHEEEEWKTWKDKDYYHTAPQEPPFGGIQVLSVSIILLCTSINKQPPKLVLSGDFCQLPPVPDHSIDWILPSIFAFDSRSWKRCITSPILLSQVFRQKDKAFVELLSSMRVGKLLPHHVAQIRELRRPIVYADGIEPSELYPLRGEVERCNDRRLKALTTPIFRYRAMDCAGWDPYLKPVKKKDAEHFLERSRAPEYINLRVGAQVMLLRNIEQGTLVNGSLGKIIEFLTVREAAERKIDIAGESSPAEGSSKHSLADDDDDPVNALPTTAVPDFAPPPAFTPLNDHVFAIDQKWPLVQFTNGRELLCSAMTFPSQGFLGNVETLRIQVPLLLAWAMSIHKSQGQTLPRVKIDVGRAFEKGQVYVAISRATCMEGLEIHNFDPGKVEVHPRVIAWQDTWLPRVDNRTPATSGREAAVEDEMVVDDDLPL
ncbi:hypothetical protein ONZ45_g17533 [Pleurotus djamor]|nr:hypothetical protein ONZ45_g17533 [Pleurotus djamor]